MQLVVWSATSARPHISLAPLGKLVNRPRSIQATNSSVLGQKYLADLSTRPSRLKHAPSCPKCYLIFDISLNFVLTSIWEIVKSMYSLPNNTIFTVLLFTRNRCTPPSMTITSLLPPTPTIIGVVPTLRIFKPLSFSGTSTSTCNFIGVDEKIAGVCCWSDILVCESAIYQNRECADPVRLAAMSKHQGAKLGLTS